MDWKGMVWKGSKGKDAAVEAPTEETVVEQETPARMPTGPMGSRRPTTTLKPTGLRRSTFATATAKVNTAKLDDLKKRVLGGTPTGFTQVLDSADKLAAAGITDEASRYRGAIATTGVTLIDFNDAVSRHKGALLAQREGFGKHLGQKRTEMAERRAAIEQEGQQLQARLAELAAEDENLVQQQEDLDVAESEFAAAADTLDVELTSLGDQIASLYQA